MCYACWFTRGTERDCVTAAAFKQTGLAVHRLRQNLTERTEADAQTSSSTASCAGRRRATIRAENTIVEHADALGMLRLCGVARAGKEGTAFPQSGGKHP
eukprot:2853479-Pyramimonas_sp.AAC.1